MLDAGIDVWTTLNVQHLETLNDRVARISGVRVRETVPDAVLELADEIELVDLPTEELIERLRAGKVYVQDQIARAVNNFFSKGNLTALRELAMRAAADRVDAQLQEHMRANAIGGPWPAQERILVAINEAPVAPCADPHCQAHGRPRPGGMDRRHRDLARGRSTARRRQGHRPWCPASGRAAWG